jgi:hypothetical protein|tara:strand:+ start:74 stop:418 length:345 start_codon:yes stop_codon:yes gene_type:complete
MFAVGKEVTSFTHTSRDGQPVLEVELATEIVSAAGILETRSQKFALAGDVAATLLSSLKVITQNLNNLIEKTTKEMQETLKAAEEPTLFDGIETVESTTDTIATVDDVSPAEAV